ncbi:MAG: hypothetical protein IPM16_19035 [Chloroflexi bacterium]|nr:hypothetical protein [Chloroflexota bacterium]
MKSNLTLTLVVVVLLAVLMSSTVTAQEERSASDYLVVLGVNPGSTCSNNSLNLLRQRSTNVLISTLAFYDGVIVSDYISEYVPADGVASWATAYGNARGLAPVNLWPLTPGKELTLIITIWSLDHEPIYESRVTLASCDSLVLSSNEHGPAHSLTRNHSFEGVGVDGGGLPDPTVAAFWKGKNAGNDLRTCDTTANFVGLCGLKLTADPATKSKFTNKYNGRIGQVGDIVLLQAYANALPGYTGGGKVIGKLTLANGQILKLSVDVPALASWTPTDTPLFVYADLPAAVTAAKTMIKQNTGLGSVALDVVMLSVLTNAGDAPRSVLPVPSFGALGLQEAPLH